MGVKDIAYTGLIHGYRAVASLFMDVPEAPRKHDCFAVSVQTVEDVAPRVRRIVVEGPALRVYWPSGPDEYFGLVIPPKGRELVLPKAKGLNVRAELEAIDEKDRPELRWYTVRHHDESQGRLTFDVVTHGESGPGSAWALRAEAGEEVGVRTMTSTWRRTEGGQLLVADPTSAPALRRILEECGRQELATTHVRIAASSPDLLEPGYDSLTSELASYRDFFVPEGEEAAAVADELREGGKLPIAYGWLCGEASLARAARKVLVKEWNIPRTDVLFSGYYRRQRGSL